MVFPTPREPPMRSRQYAIRHWRTRSRSTVSTHPENIRLSSRVDARTLADVFSLANFVEILSGHAAYKARVGQCIQRVPRKLAD